MDPDLDFAALFARFDALLMGRKTWQAAAVMHGGGGGGFFGMPTYVASTTLGASTTNGAKPPKGVPLIDRDLIAQVRELKATPPSAPGKEIWLFGGGELFAALLDAGLIDFVELAVIPVLLGKRHTLRLDSHRIYPKSGTAWMSYALTN